MTRFQKYTIAGSAILGVATVILGIIMVFTFPKSAKLSEGFRTPIIAFEFAKTQEDLSFLSGNSEINRLNREKMDAGHKWDMVFPFAYGGFIILILLQIIKKGHYFALLGVLFALLIIPFDINENLILLGITDALGKSNSIETLLIELHTATWLKWGAIGISIAVLSVGLMARKEYVLAILSSLTPLSIAACRVSKSEPNIAEVMAIATFVFFFIFSIKACIQAWEVIHQKV